MISYESILPKSVGPRRICAAFRKRTGGHLALARDGGQGAAERADLEDALARGLHLRRSLLGRRNFRLA